MSEHLTMNTIIHAAFRRDLARFEHALGAFPAGSQARAEPSAGNAQAAHDAITRLTGTFVSHLIHGENDLEPFAARAKSTQQMKAAQVAVRKAHKGGAGTFVAWLQDGADPDARSALRREIPAPVLFVMGRFAGRDYRRRIAPVWA